MVRRIGRRLGLTARETDLTATLTALHLKIGFMGHSRTDYPPERLARAAGPFGEELAVLSWADRLAAQGPRLKPEHLRRHEDLCTWFLRVSRELGPYPDPDYAALQGELSSSSAPTSGTRRVISGFSWPVGRMRRARLRARCPSSSCRRPRWGSCRIAQRA